MNHLEVVNAGRLYVDGDLIGYRERGDKLYEMSPKDAAKQRRDIGMVFQHFNLFPHRTALENVIEAPTQVKKQKKDAALARARELLDRVGLADKPIPIRPSSPAGSNNESPSLVPSPWNPS